MRRLGRNRARSEEEESVFVTMTDMTISFLLIIMILLAFFATQMNEDDTVPRSVYEVVRQERDELRRETIDLKALVGQLRADIIALQRDLRTVTRDRDQLQLELNRVRDENETLRARIRELEAANRGLLSETERLRRDVANLEAEVARLERIIERLRVVSPLEAYQVEAVEQRREILVQIRERLRVEFPDLDVVVSPEQDALRFQGEGLFRSGSRTLQPRQERIVSTMGRLLDEILVCFTLGPRAKRGADCQSGNALIEAVQVEGHTDSDGSDPTNLDLSTNRANETFLVMLKDNPGLLDHKNWRDQPVLSVSGYGEMRPIETNNTPEGKAANRRIDLRIIMYSPSTAEEVELIGQRLDALRTAGREE